MALFCKTCGTRVENKAAQQRHCAGRQSLAVHSPGLARPIGPPAGDCVIDACIVPQGEASLVRVRPEPLARRVNPLEGERRAVKFLLWPFHEVFFPDLFSARRNPSVAGTDSGSQERQEIIKLLSGWT
jgi:hypothetical protein